MLRGVNFLHCENGLVLENSSVLHGQFWREAGRLLFFGDPMVKSNQREVRLIFFLYGSQAGNTQEELQDLWDKGGGPLVAASFGCKYFRTFSKNLFYFG